MILSIIIFLLIVFLLCSDDRKQLLAILGVILLGIIQLIVPIILLAWFISLFL